MSFGPIDDQLEAIVARVAANTGAAVDDPWVARAVDAAAVFAIAFTNRGELGLPDDPLVMFGLSVFGERILLDSANGAQVAIGDPSFEPIFQPEHLWKHVRHFFDLHDVGWGVS